MRFLEILLFVFIFVSLATRVISSLRKIKIPVYLSFASGIIVPFQILIDGYRWQMTPVYVITAGLVIAGVIQLAKKKNGGFLINNKIIRRIAYCLVVIIFLLSLLFPLLLPVADLPEPGGPYEVGTTNFKIIDKDRKEIMTEDPDDCRNFLVTAWYPAQITEKMQPSSYWDKEGVTGRAYSINSGMGTFWYSHLTLVRTNSYTDVPVSSNQDSYPVVIYSPSFYSLNTDNTMLFEELASNGYIVFSIAPTYEDIVSVFPDGEAVYGDLDYLNETFDAHADKELQYYKDYDDASDTEEKKELVKKILAVDDTSTALIRTRTQDIVFLLDKLEQMNSADGILSGKLDLDEIGILGWSFGGATALDACIADSRFKAGVNIDGWPYGELFNSDKTVKQPFMIMRSEHGDEIEDIISEIEYDKLENPECVISIDGAWHENFWDFPYFFRVYKHIGYWGPIKPERLLEIEKAYITGFFDKHLKGSPEALEDLEFSEVTKLH